jgi:hypothetical protein
VCTFSKPCQQVTWPVSKIAVSFFVKIVIVVIRVVIGTKLLMVIVFWGFIFIMVLWLSWFLWLFMAGGRGEGRTDSRDC